MLLLVAFLFFVLVIAAVTVARLFLPAHVVAGAASGTMRAMLWLLGLGCVAFVVVLAYAMSL